MSLRRRLAAVDGQTASEYMGMLLVIATTIFALVSIHVDRTIAHEIKRLICQVSEERCDAKKPRAREPTPAQRRLARLDRDRDGLSNRAERRLGTNPNRADSDGDGLSDGRERNLRLNPTVADTDDDGLPDGVEVRDALRRTSPNDADTDDDGLTDGEELAIGTNPSRRDSDFGDPDGLTDAQEIALGTDPNVLDTDGDGDPDGAEFREGHDPLKDERSIFGKARDFILDHPVDLAVGGVGGAGRNLAGRYVERFLSRTGRLRRIGSAGSREEAAAIRHERLDAFRQRMAEARARAREERGEVGVPGGRPTPPRPAPSKIDLARPDDLRGVSPDDVERLAREAGFESSPARAGGGGTRFFAPGTRQSDGIRVMRGDPRAPETEPIKRGPYALIAHQGRTTRIPLAGNPVLRHGGP